MEPKDKPMPAAPRDEQPMPPRPAEVPEEDPHDIPDETVIEKTLPAGTGRERAHGA
jgi:hypothetical protein